MQVNFRVTSLSCPREVPKALRVSFQEVVGAHHLLVPSHHGVRCCIGCFHVNNAVISSAEGELDALHDAEAEAARREREAAEAAAKVTNRITGRRTPTPLSGPDFVSRQTWAVI